MESILHTVGHSSHSADHFASLLRSHSISAVCDVRSTPYSRRNPQFDRETLQARLSLEGVTYVFLGEELGARSDDPGCYVDGRVQYRRLAETSSFRKGLSRVQLGIDSYRVALMCAERDPLTCHRTILICRNLRRPGLSIQHILADGTLESHADAEHRLVRTLGLAQIDLFSPDSNCVDKAYDVQAAKIAYVKAPEQSPPSPEFGRP